MTGRIQKCQAKNPDLCTDPQCPERRGIAHQMAQAKNFDQYSAAAKTRHDLEQRRGVAQMAQRMGHYPPQKRNNSQQKPTRPVVREHTREGDPVIKFHKDLGMPPGFVSPTGTRRVKYTRHAQEQAQEDIYGAIPQLKTVNLDQMELVELKVNARTKQVYRYLYRGELDDENDVCLVLQPNPRDGSMTVITNWINKHTDAHRTLRREEYMIPRQANG